MKATLALIIGGVLGCGFAIFYAKKFAMTGSQPVFVTLYTMGALLAAFGAARIIYLLICRRFPRLKIPGVVFGLVAFAAVIVGLFFPFYLIG